MKYAGRLLVLILVCVMMISTLCGDYSCQIDAYASRDVTIYAPDGRSAVVDRSELEAYLNVGWYRTETEVQHTIFAPDGRMAVVYLAEVDTYVNLGWYRTYEDATIMIYSPDGRSARVYRAFVNDYLELGWYLNYSDIVKTIYTLDGRSASVYLSELETYLNLGWYQNISDVTRTIYAADGRSALVFASEVNTYLGLGWSLRVPVDPGKPMIALTFDDGPSAYYTRRIVDTLVKYNATATFFVVGTYVERYPSIVNYALKNGMEIGNHSYSHSNLANLSADGISNEISSTNQAIYNNAGIYPTLCRPPYGSVSHILKENTYMPLVLWSVDTLDWQSRNANAVYNKIAGKVSDGDIILMHDLYKSTADAVDMIVPYLINSGFQIVSVSELAKYKGYEMYSGNTYNSFR